jgi:hypothetical protein
MTERELAICVMFDNLKAQQGLNPDETPLSAQDMLDFLNDIWALCGGEAEEAGLVLNTVTHRFYNPDEKLELTQRTYPT